MLFHVLVNAIRKRLDVIVRTALCVYVDFLVSFTYFDYILMLLDLTRGMLGIINTQGVDQEGSIHDWGSLACN